MKTYSRCKLNKTVIFYFKKDKFTDGSCHFKNQFFKFTIKGRQIKQKQGYVFRNLKFKQLDLGPVAFFALICELQYKVLTQYC